MHRLNQIIIEGLALSGITLCGLSLLCQRYFILIFAVGMIGFVAANIASQFIEERGN